MCIGPWNFNILLHLNNISPAAQHSNCTMGLIQVLLRLQTHDLWTCEWTFGKLSGWICQLLRGCRYLLSFVNLFWGNFIASYREIWMIELNNQVLPHVALEWLMIYLNILLGSCIFNLRAVWVLRNRRESVEEIYFMSYDPWFSILPHCNWSAWLQSDHISMLECQSFTVVYAETLVCLIGCGTRMLLQHVSGLWCQKWKM